MRFADSCCAYEEQFKPVHVYIYTGECIECQNPVTVRVPAEGLYKYRQGALIQNAFPEMSSNNREFLISGICGKCFDEMFKEPEE